MGNPEARNRVEGVEGDGGEHIGCLGVRVLGFYWRYLVVRQICWIRLEHVTLRARDNQESRVIDRIPSTTYGPDQGNATDERTNQTKETRLRKRKNQTMKPLLPLLLGNRYHIIVS
jgi:hypothetical protein